MAYKHNSSPAFTIVELLVVIVVIGILAAITIVSYTGISSRATVSSLQSDLTNAVTQLKLDQVTNSMFPSSLAAANGGKGIPPTSGTSYTYAYSNTTTPQTFCITATKNNISYNITQDGNSQPGICPVLNLDAGNISSYPGTGTTWTDLSGNGNSGTLYGGVTYSNTNGGVLSFDGGSGYVAISDTASLNNLTVITISAWVKPISDVYIFQHGSSSSINGYVNTFRITSSGALYLDIEDSTTNIHFSPSSSDGVVHMNVWNYVSAVVKNNLLEFYVNGVKVYTSGMFNGMYPLAGSSDAARNIGRYYYNSSTAIGYSTGAIGNVSVYNKALSVDEINQNFNAFRSRYGI